MDVDENVLSDAPEGEELELKDGETVNSIPDLSKMLPMLSESAFRFHQDKGDFSEWVERVFGDLDLARQIREARTKHFMKRQIDARLEELKKGNFNSRRK